jgi:hypothetical protein
VSLLENYKTGKSRRRRNLGRGQGNVRFIRSRFKYLSQKEEKVSWKVLSLEKIPR